MQTSYGYATDVAVAGGLADLSDYAVESRKNTENDGVLKFGMGVVVGTTAGKEVKIPTANTDKFEGVAGNGFTTEMDMSGNLSVKKGAIVGCISHGKVWVRVKNSETIAYNDTAYLVYSGDYKGYFSKTATNAIPVGTFKSAVTTGSTATGIAMVELGYDHDTTYTLPTATASALGGVKVGTGLNVATDGTISVAQ